MSAALAVGQALWVFPAMADLAESVAAQDERITSTALLERIANGGSYAGFGIANGLGIALVAIIPCVVAALWMTYQRHNVEARNTDNTISSLWPNRTIRSASAVALVS